MLIAQWLMAQGLQQTISWYSDVLMMVVPSSFSLLLEMWCMPASKFNGWYEQGNIFIQSRTDLSSDEEQLAYCVLRGPPHTTTRSQQEYTHVN
jgi:hypothetical protein